MLKLLIADDHFVVQVGTFMILKEVFTDLYADFASNYEEVKEKVAVNDFDLVMLDINMPGSIYTSMVKDLRTLKKDLPILIFTAYEESIAFQYYREGINGFLNKLASRHDIVLAVEAIFQTGYYYSPYVISHILEKKAKSPVDLLSERELAVFNLLAEGFYNLEIAVQLKVEESTIATYKRRLYKKLKIDNLAELIKIYNLIH